MFRMVLFCVLVAVMGCDGPVGPQGEIGATGAQGENGEAISAYFDYVVKAADVTQSDVGSYMVLIIDSRIQPGAMYQIWVDIDSKGWMKIDMYYNNGNFEYMVVISDGFIGLTVDSDFTGQKLRIFKI